MLVSPCVLSCSLPRVHSHLHVHENRVKILDRFAISVIRGIGVVCSCSTCLRFKQKRSIATALLYELLLMTMYDTLAVFSVKILFSRQSLGSLHNCNAPCGHCFSLQPLYCFKHKKALNSHI